jgi:hypothetical protein
MGRGTRCPVEPLLSPRRGPDDLADMGSPAVQGVANLIGVIGAIVNPGDASAVTTHMIEDKELIAATMLITVRLMIGFL